MFNTAKSRIVLIIAAAMIAVAAADPQSLQDSRRAPAQPHQSGPLMRGAPPEPKAEVDSVVDDLESKMCVVRNVGWCNYEPAGQKGSTCSCGRLYGQLN
jgi:hypothetical protein